MDKGDVATLFNGAHEATGLTAEKIAIGCALLIIVAIAAWRARR